MCVPTNGISSKMEPKGSLLKVPSRAATMTTFPHSASPSQNSFTSRNCVRDDDDEEEEEEEEEKEEKEKEKKKKGEREGKERER